MRSIFAVLFLFCPTFLLAAEPEMPNIVLFFCDDLGYGDIGPFGSDNPTPHLDRLAAEGRRFTNFLVSSAVCSSSRAALMTGCYHQRVGVHGAYGPNSNIGLHPDEETVAEVLKKKGYATAIYGKWHLGDHPEFLPTNRGFDEYFGLAVSNDMWPYHPEVVNLPDDHPRRNTWPPLRIFEGSERLPEIVTPEMQKNLTMWYTERGVKFIEASKDKPFFLYIPHSMPHVPLYVSDKFDGKSGKGLYGDVVMEIDWSVGEIVATLRRLNLDKNTLIIFTSDNGPWLSYGNHSGVAGPLREGKGTSLEGGVRVPTLFWMPGKIPANSTCDQLASTIDILPTLALLTGAPLPEKRIDGKDIRPLVFGEPGAKSPHEAFAIYYDRQLHAVRDTQWKLVFPHQYRTMEGQTPGKDGFPGQYAQRRTPLALFDLVNDIGETTDVSAEHPEIVKRLQEVADAIRAELGEGNENGPGVRPAARINEIRNR
ncbi:MAG: sulfatase [Planctomycetaceae bacterium]|nr:sulfatase [Planctomycetaceae bacterium]